MAEQESKDLGKQVEIAERLQLKWLLHMEILLNTGAITSTDLATLARFLQNNGWSLDPTKLPKGLRDKLTSHLKPEDFDNETQEPRISVMR